MYHSKTIMDTYLIIFFLFCGLSESHGSVISDINNVIVSILTKTAKENNLSSVQFMDDIIDSVQLSNDHVTNHGNVIKDIGACTKTFNISACRDLLAENCYDVKNLLKSTMSEDESITKMFPTLVYHLYRPKCTDEKSNMTQEEHKNKMPSAKVWGYGVGFCLLICFISNIGGLLGPLMNTTFFQKLLLFCVALAVGTLAATGFLVLLPESMHLTGEDSPVPDYHHKMITAMAGVYFFYVSETLMKIWFNRDDPKPDKVAKEDGNTELENLNKEALIETEQNNIAQIEHGHTHLQKNGKKKIATVAWMILIGDALHNFVDGISIGAAFTESTQLGVSVSLAILCEELPHELGDIAILLHAGMSMKRALFSNFIAAIVCLAGLVVGVNLGENTDANTWIFAVAGGMFIYIALVDMFNEMKIQATMAVQEKSGSVMSVFLIQNIGLIVGFLIIASLVFFY